ncbi:MAG: hypothetical protein VB085_08715 [Peptococcaceae bacterium]|nr:hypothetical protein [Peptococcaceae bacterium]
MEKSVKRVKEALEWAEYSGIPAGSRRANLQELLILEGFDDETQIPVAIAAELYREIGIAFEVHDGLLKGTSLEGRAA